MFESRLFFSGHLARLWLARRAGTVLCPSGNPCKCCRQQGLLLWDMLWDLEPMAGAWEGFWLGEVTAASGDGCCKAPLSVYLLLFFFKSFPYM